MMVIDRRKKWKKVKQEGVAWITRQDKIKIHMKKEKVRRKGMERKRNKTESKKLVEKK